MAILEATDIIRQFRQYDDIVTAVNRASLSVTEGKYVAIIGESGSGKSTFINNCAGLDEPDSGSVFIGGRDITRMNYDELAQFRGKISALCFSHTASFPI